MIRNNDPNDNEKYFEWWLNDLHAIGIVKDYFYEPQTFVIQELLPFYVKQVYKTKDPIIKTKTLFDNLVWTVDYKVIFDMSLLNKLFGVFDVNNRLMKDDPNIEAGNVYQNTLFYTTNQDNENPEENTLWFDVKPPQITSKTASGRDFRFVSRLLFNRYGIYVNKVNPVGTPNSLYYKTFFPDRYLMNDSNSAPRRKRMGGKKGPLTNIKEFDFYKSLHSYLKIKNVRI